MTGSRSCSDRLYHKLGPTAAYWQLLAASYYMISVLRSLKPLNKLALLDGFLLDDRI